MIAEGRTRSRFMGLWRIAGVSEDPPPYSDDYPRPLSSIGNYYYDLERLPAFDVFSDRLIVDWGLGTRSWVQWWNPLKPPKPVLELLPPGAGVAFQGFDDVHLSFAELERIVRNPESNATWHSVLSKVGGVYLIVDGVSAEQYVGSASGEKGILGRWRSYVRTKHGGNQLLKKLLAEHPDRYQRFHYSILRTVPRSMTATEVINLESQFEAKLSSRAFGLNAN